MEALNQRLFVLLNAPSHPGAGHLFMARGLAEGLIWLIPLILAVGWVWGNDRHRLVMLEAATASLAGLLTNQLIGLIWQHPRPFMINLGHTFLHHAPDSSFPSDHLTVFWAVAFCLLLHDRFRLAGLCLALLGIPVAWSRIYLGIHFPLDMFGALLVAMLNAWLVFQGEQRFCVVCYRPMLATYRVLAGPLIRRGWIAG